MGLGEGRRLPPGFAKLLPCPVPVLTPTGCPRASPSVSHSHSKSYLGDRQTSSAAGRAAGKATPGTQLKTWAVPPELLEVPTIPPWGREPRRCSLQTQLLEPGIWKVVNPWSPILPAAIQLCPPRPAPPLQTHTQTHSWCRVGRANSKGRGGQLPPTHKGRGGQGCHVVAAGAGSGVGQVAVGGLEASLHGGRGSRWVEVPPPLPPPLPTSPGLLSSRQGQGGPANAHRTIHPSIFIALPSPRPQGWQNRMPTLGPVQGGQWLDWGVSECTDLPRIPTEIHLFVLKQKEKEDQEGLARCQQMPGVRELRMAMWVTFWCSLRWGSAYSWVLPCCPLACRGRSVCVCGGGRAAVALPGEAVGAGGRSDLASSSGSAP